MQKKKYTYEEFKKLPFEQRRDYQLEARAKKPTFIPVILYKTSSSNFPTLPECRMIVPQNMTVFQFKFEIDKIKKSQSGSSKAQQSTFLFANGQTMGTSTMKQQYQKYLKGVKNSDGWFYILISPTATF